MLTFSLLSIVMVVGAIGVITLKQPVHAALSLVGTLLTLAVTYVTLQAHFLATIQVIVYAGAIMVLFLFVIMLLNIQGEEREDTFVWMRPVAYGVALLAAAGITIGAFQNASPLPNPIMIARALGGGGAEQVGGALFTDFILAFQLVGILLLTGIIGAVSLVQRKAEEAVEAQRQVAIAAAPSRKEGGVAVLERDDKPDRSAKPTPKPTLPPKKEPPKADASPKVQPPREAVTELKSEPKEKGEAQKQGGEADAQSKVDDAEKKSSAKSKAKEDKSKEASKPKESKADDLKRIKGVGPKLEKLLNRNGITSFEQIANLNAKEIEELDSKLESFQGRIERDNWLEQAQELAEEKKNG